VLPLAPLSSNLLGKAPEEEPTMRITCHHCQAGWEYADRRPAFCPFCGQPFPGDPLAASPSPAGEVTTPFISENVTQPPSTPHDNGAADPEEVGGYRLLRVLGAGGMGKVYEAADVQTGRRVALKLISADYAGSPEAVERFRQEGRLASLVAHPRCVFVLAADEEAGRPYIVMELMPGNSLDDYIRHHGPQPPGEAVAMILDVIEGLQEAHRVGVVHRDVKPSNCFFGADGRLKVGDFGLSKSLAQGAHLTKTGSFLGTPLYASPEQVRGEQVDAQTDVYSTAATLYFLLTGRAPFQSDNAAVTLARIASDPPPSLRTLRPELSPALDAVVLRGLERDRKRRWRDLDEFAEALRPFLLGRLSLAGLGVRFGALALDYGSLMLSSWPLTILWIALGLIDNPFKNQEAAYFYCVPRVDRTQRVEV
jgi:serine/threonine protein kinase